MNPSLGSALWRLLHTYAYHYPEAPTASDRSAATAWLAEFADIVKANSAGCNCDNEWSRLCREVPPDLTSRSTFYWWTAAAHDRVNKRLGKPLMWPGLNHALLA